LSVDRTISTHSLGGELLSWGLASSGLSGGLLGSVDSTRGKGALVSLGVQC
jgi:hypothetical protein